MDNSKEEIKDEYNISEVLKRHGIEDSSLLKDIDDHLDKILTVYLQDSEQQRKSVNTEWYCCLMMALMKTENCDKAVLVDRIQHIIDSCKIDEDKV